ncbi:MAG: hypothetical protein JSS10_08695 [Verrucomicrobia bacterium]|nr:hypothetical protein [Verrucomicrobiota bacterium]
MDLPDVISVVSFGKCLIPYPGGIQVAFNRFFTWIIALPPVVYGSG